MADEEGVVTTPEEDTEEKGTSFEDVYNFFLAGITDDMFMEMTKEDTVDMLKEILFAALPHFEFPRDARIFDITFSDDSFKCQLTLEELRIIRSYMVVEWINYQLASIENVRQKYSGSDFSFTSQASHIDKLIKLKTDYQEEGFHLQRLYCRRHKSKKGHVVSSLGKIMEKRTW